MEINPDTIIALLTFFVLLHISKIQNKKINIQSSIIKDQENYNKFFDINKLKEFIELSDLQNDKFLKLERQCLQKEIKLQKLNFVYKHCKNKKFTQIINIE